MSLSHIHHREKTEPGDNLTTLMPIKLDSLKKRNYFN